ncbi:4a-hydroxytetrahydrobiopterin dehydratase [Brevibacillus migulae]|uniref:4a-hydroxytetrahydrobiopterin dehydratase n=1 Tax=Brevibacillus migulae TaxID=1644114 RepID=UPI00106E54B8|nr:4a-hydroxytetrahydrobiopterin dehydratase [Brevibacillus migulae]
MSKLTLEQVKFNLGKIPGWKLVDHPLALSRTFSCDDFHSAVRLINQIAEYIGQDHEHLEIKLMDNQLTLTLSTRKANGLTGKDFALAQTINKLV